MRTPLGAVLRASLALCLAAAGLGAQQSPATPAAPSWAAVTYLSGVAAYLEVGTKQGVVEGTLFTVVRGGQVIGELTATFVSSSRTACTIKEGTPPLMVGDSVRYVPTVAAAPAEVVGAARSPTRRATRRAPIRGRIGVRYLTSTNAGGMTLQQPSLDLRLDGSQIGGTAFGVTVDARMHRNSVSGGSTSSPTGATRVYQAALVRQGSVNGSRLAVGRQFATALSPIGIFDGAAFDLHGTRWSGGALAGTVPDPASFAPSAATTEAGVWLQRHNALGSATSWNATIGAIGSYTRGEIDREFLYLRGAWNSRTLSVYAAEEIDVNRGWKREAEGRVATFTSTVLMVHMNVSRAVSLGGGLDSRRSVRLFRDFVNPEIAFDDAIRQGQWGQLSIRPSRHVRLQTDVRTNGGGTEGRSSAFTASVSAMQFTSLGLGVRARSTQYQGARSGGRLSSISIEAAPSSALRLSVNTGLRTSKTPGSTVPETRLTWAGGDLDLNVGRSVYLMLSTYREMGTVSASVQSYGSVTWRF